MEEQEQTPFARELAEKSNKLQNMVLFRRELNNLLNSFQALVTQASQEYAEYTYYNDVDDEPFELSDISKEIQQNFLVWHQKYQAMLEQAIDLKLVDQAFIEHYKDYSVEDWDRDEAWNKVKNFYLQRDTAVEDIVNLDITIRALDEDKKGRDFVYKVIGGVFSLTVVIPLIVLIIYAIDSKVTAKEISEKGMEKADTETRKKGLEDSIKNSEVGELKGNLYYQAAQLSKPFFAPLKTAKKEGAEKIEGTPHVSPKPSPSHSDSED